MGPERLELPTTYTGIETHMAIDVKEGEEKWRGRFWDGEGGF